MSRLIKNLPLFHNKPVPLLLPIFEFLDPPQLKSPIEEEMLDYGFLTSEYLDIITHGSELSDLELSFHSSEAILDAVDYFED